LIDVVAAFVVSVVVVPEVVVVGAVGADMLAIPLLRW
jgi:hypothetical protein